MWTERNRTFWSSLKEKVRNNCRLLSEIVINLVRERWTSGSKWRAWKQLQLQKQCGSGMILVDLLDSILVELQILGHICSAGRRVTNSQSLPSRSPHIWSLLTWSPDNVASERYSSSTLFIGGRLRGFQVVKLRSLISLCVEQVKPCVRLGNRSDQRSIRKNFELRSSKCFFLGRNGKEVGKNFFRRSGGTTFSLRRALLPGKFPESFRATSLSHLKATPKSVWRD